MCMFEVIMLCRSANRHVHQSFYICIPRRMHIGLSVCIYICTAIYQNAESTNGDIQVKVSSVWQRCGSVKATTAERWRRVCMQTHFHMDMVKPVQLWTPESENKQQPHGNKYINICILLVFIVDILHLYPWISRGLVVTVYLLFIYCISTVYLLVTSWMPRPAAPANCTAA